MNAKSQMTVPPSSGNPSFNTEDTRVHCEWLVNCMKEKFNNRTDSELMIDSAVKRPWQIGQVSLEVSQQPGTRSVAVRGS